MSDKAELEALASMIAREIKGAPPKPKLCLIKRDDLAKPAQQQQDHITRMCRLDRIRWLSRAYGLEPLVKQYTFGKPGLDCLENDQLHDLHRKLEHAREVLTDPTISFDDAGLIDNVS